MLTRVLAYGFAFFLLFLEWILRSLSKIDSHEFIGPTLAAAGVGFLVPLTTARNQLSNLPEPTQKALNGFIVVTKKEHNLAVFTLLFLLVLIASWTYDLYLVCTKTSGFWGISSVWLGIMTYFAAVVISEVRGD